MNELPLVECWNRIGVRGDRTCPELPKVGHCHNCPVFSAAGRQFLNVASPAGYLEEWTERLAVPPPENVSDLLSVLIFRIGEEWLALPVQVLVEVATPRPIHRVPHRGGALAGLVNIRGELHLCVYLAQVLGIATAAPAVSRPVAQAERLLVVRRAGVVWALPVDEVDQVSRVPLADLAPAPATLTRSVTRLGRGVFGWHGRSVGLLDEARLFEALGARIK